MAVSGAPALTSGAKAGQSDQKCIHPLSRFRPALRGAVWPQSAGHSLAGRQGAAVNRGEPISTLIQRVQPVDGIYVLTGVQRRTDRKNNPFWDFFLKDSSGSVNGKIWATRGRLTPETLESDIYAHVVGRSGSYNNTPQVTVDSVTPLTPEEIAGLDEADFVAPSPYDGRAAYEELMALAEREFTYEPWKNIVRSFFADGDNAALFMRASAATSMHHAGSGGLAVHTLGVFRVCQAEADVYPDMDRQILLAGALFHDIGKMREMKSTVFETTYTPEGNLMGHLVLGCFMLEPYCRAAGLPDALREHFFHLILSHHGRIDFGAVKLPQSREALALSTADYLDSHMNMMDLHLKDVPTGQCSYVKGLDAGLYHPERTPGGSSDRVPSGAGGAPGVRGSEENAGFEQAPASASVKNSGDAGVLSAAENVPSSEAGPQDIPDDWVECPPEEIPFDEAMPEDFVMAPEPTPDCHTEEVEKNGGSAPEKPEREETAGEGRRKLRKHTRVQQGSLLNLGEK